MSEIPEIRFQEKVRSLREGIQKVYENKEFCDVVFTIKGEHQFEAHKLVLSARSPVFARMFLGTSVPDEIIIEEDSVTATGFEILLRFIYTDKIGTEDRKAIVEAYITAIHYEQGALKSACERRINRWSITKDDVCGMLNAGLSIDPLRERCIAFIKDNTDDVLTSSSFLDISLKCLKTILESGALNSVPILQRINRIMEWAAKQYSSITDKQDYSIVRDEFLKDNPPLLRNLEFEILTPNDWPYVMAKYKGLLTYEEFGKFMEYSVDKTVSLPYWHSEKIDSKCSTSI